jgi:predicted nucleic acid-binding protein
MDASSAIILCKSGLHTLLVGMYDIVLPSSVYREITANQYEDAEEYKLLAAAGELRIEESPIQPEESGIFGLDAGECEAIQLYQNGMGDFIITDDGAAARYCRRQGIPFINALLFPVILRFALMKDDVFCHRSMEKIIATGRYSKEVITFALECRREDVAFALP